MQDSYLDLALNSFTEEDIQPYEYISEVVREELRKKGVIIIGSKTDFMDKVNCKEYLRLYLNEKFNFSLRRGQLSHYIEMGLILGNLNLCSRVEPAKDYICIYTSFIKEGMDLNACVDHVGIVIDKTNEENPIVLSKYNHSNLIIHSAHNQEIMDSFCPQEDNIVLFIDIIVLKSFIHSLI